MTRTWRAFLAAMTLATGTAISQTPGPDSSSAPSGSSEGGVPFVPGEQPRSGQFDGDVNRLLPQDGPFKVFGWLDGGYAYNANNGANRFNGPYNAVDRDEPMFNQAYLVLERELPQCGFGVGGRLGMIYGFDYNLAQSRGFELTRDGDSKWNGNQYYGFAIPQAYVDLGNKDLSVQAGHFYSIVGYEGLTAPSNFFYTHSYSYQFAGPFTHWGAIGTWRPSQNLQIQAGAVNGWNALDRVGNSAHFIGGVKYTADDNSWWTSFAAVTGREDSNALIPAGAPAAAVLATPAMGWRSRYSFLVGLNPTCNLEYVFHHWLGAQENGVFGSGKTALWYGIDQYLYYKLSDQWRVGGRAEWFRDDDGTRVGLNRPANPNTRPLAGDYYSFTFGLNYTPVSNVRIRPEVRYDTYSGNAGPYYGSKDQLLFAVDMILQF